MARAEVEEAEQAQHFLLAPSFDGVSRSHQRDNKPFVALIRQSPQGEYRPLDKCGHGRGRMKQRIVVLHDRQRQA